MEINLGDNNNAIQRPLLNPQHERNQPQPSRKTTNRTINSMTELATNNQLHVFLEKVGTGDWYQVQVFAQFCLQVLCVSWFLTSTKYYFEEPDFICPKDYNVNDQGQRLSDLTCSQWVCNLKKEKPQIDLEQFISFNSFYSATRNFNMMCEDNYLRYVAVGISYLFTILGLLFFSQSSDTSGRKQALQTCWKMFTIGYIIFPYVQVFPLFMFGYCMCSFSCLSAIVLQITMLNEQTTGKIRQQLGAGLWLMLSFGQCIFVLLVYLISDWVIVSTICGTIPVLCMNWVIKVYFESARFYYPTKKLKAIRTLNKIADVNGKEPLNVNLEDSTWVENWQSISKNVFVLFKYTSLKKMTICGYFMMLCLYFMYYGSEEQILLIPDMNYDLQVFLILLGKFVGYLIITILIDKLNRIKTFKVNVIIGIVLMVAYYIMDYIYMGSSSQLKGMKVNRAVSAMNIIVGFLYFAELYPTAVRTIGLGTIMTTQQLSFLFIYWFYGDFYGFSSLSNTETKGSDFIVMSVMIVSSIVALGLAFMMPETKGQSISDEIDEIAIAQHDNFVIQRKSFIDRITTVVH